MPKEEDKRIYNESKMTLKERIKEIGKEFIQAQTGSIGGDYPVEQLSLEQFTTDILKAFRESLENKKYLDYNKINKLERIISILRNLSIYIYSVVWSNEKQKSRKELEIIAEKIINKDYINKSEVDIENIGKLLTKEFYPNHCEEIDNIIAYYLDKHKEDWLL